MNQPISSCLIHFEKHINLGTALQSDPPISESDDLDQRNFEPPEFMDTSEDYTYSSLSSSASQNPEGKQKSIQYPTSGSVYGRGETFMDQCNTDRLETRKRHLYYSFASRDE